MSLFVYCMSNVVLAGAAPHSDPARVLREVRRITLPCGLVLSARQTIPCSAGSLEEAADLMASRYLHVRIARTSGGEPPAGCMHRHVRCVACY